MTKRFLSLLLVSLFSVSSAPMVWADSAPFTAAHAPELERRLTEAKRALDEIMASDDKSIPQELLAKAKAIAIYPRVLKGAFIFGARYGRGVVLKKDDTTGKWGPVAFSTLAGGNAGFQIGGQLTDYVLVIMNERGLKGLLSNNFTLGADASFAAGPVGRKSSVGTDLSLHSEILAYAHSMGLFAGISLDGAVLTQDNNSNSLYYGTTVSSKDILLENTVQPQPSSQPLIEALDHYTTLWATTPHDSIAGDQPAEQTPDFQGYVESFDYANGAVTLIDSRPMKDPAQGKVANTTIKMSSKDLASLKLEDEIQVYYDKTSTSKQKEAKKIVKLRSRRG